MMRFSPLFGLLQTLLLLAASWVRPPCATGIDIPCINYSSYFNWLSIIPSHPLIDGLTIHDGTLHYVSYESGDVFFRSIDVSDPFQPRFFPPHQVRELLSIFSISGQLLVIGTGTTWLNAYDLSDPNHLILQDHLNLANPIRDILVSGDYAYVSAMNYNADDGIHVVNLKDPSSLHVDGYLPLSYGPIELGFQDPYLYVSSPYGFLYIVDVSSPQAPQVVNVFDDIDDFHPRSMLVRDDVLYVVDYLHGLRILDISNPVEPTLVGGVMLPETTWGIAIDGDRLFLQHEWGLYIYECSDPTSPVFTGFIPRLGGVAADGGFIYSSGGSIIGVSDLNTSFQFPEIEAQIDTPGSANDVLMVGEKAVVADVLGGLRIVSLQDVSNPIEIGSLVWPSFWPEKLFLSGATLYGCSRSPYEETGKLWIVDLSNVALPEIVSDTVVPETPSDVAAIGKFVWVSTPGSGLLTIDATIPSNPQVVNTWGAEHEIRAIRPIDADHLIVAGDLPLTVLKVTDPVSPQVVHELIECSDGVDVATYGTRGYVTAQSGRFYVMDLSIPESPVVLGRAQSYGFGIGLAVNEKHAYAGDFLGVSVLDIQSPTEPEVLGHLPLQFRIGLDVSGSLIVAASGPNGITILPSQCASTSTQVSAHLSPTAVWFPNPFQDHSDLGLHSEVLSPLRVDIYDVTGRVQYQLEDDALPAGNHRIQWNGKDKNGKAVPPGVYFTKIRLGSSVTNQKLVRIR